MSAKHENLDLWNRVCTTDPKMTKEVSFGRKFTAIDPQYQIKNATAEWGAYGSKWGLKDIERNFDLIDEKGNTILLMIAKFYYPNGEFELSTSAKMFPGKTPKFDEDIFKKTETDLLTKALSKLGFNADVFMGKFDDNRYVAEAYNEAKIKEEMTLATSSQIDELKHLMNATQSDENKMLSFVQVDSFDKITVPMYEKLKHALMVKKQKMEKAA